jgi:hypothetical protein
LAGGASPQPAKAHCCPRLDDVLPMLGLLCEAGDAGSIDPPPTLLSTMRAMSRTIEPRPPLQLRCAALCCAACHKRAHIPFAGGSRSRHHSTYPPGRSLSHIDSIGPLVAPEAGRALVSCTFGTGGVVSAARTLFLQASPPTFVRSPSSITPLVRPSLCSAQSFARLRTSLLTIHHSRDGEQSR